MPELFGRIWDMPSADTFTVPSIAAFCARHLQGAKVIVDPFARNSRLGTHRNDLNPETAAEYHLDAVEFCAKLEADGVLADAILFDPPYSPRQISEVYVMVGREATMEDTQSSFWAEVRVALAEVLRPDGIALSFGWHSSGFGKDWPRIETLMVCHGGAHNDTICVAQRKPIPLPRLWA